MNTFNTIDVLCRTCLNQPSETIELIHLDTMESTFMQTTIRQKLEAFAPELDLTVEFSSFICNNCVAAIEFVYKFKKKCLETEEYVQNYTGQVLEEHDHKGTFLQITDVHSLSNEPCVEGLSNGFPPKLVDTIKCEPDDSQTEINQSVTQNINPHLEIVDFASVLFNTDDNIEINTANDEIMKDTVDINNEDEAVKDKVEINNDGEVMKDKIEINNVSDEVVKDKVEINNDNDGEKVKRTVEIINSDNVDEAKKDKLEVVNKLDDKIINDFSEDSNNDACSVLSEDTSTSNGNTENADNNNCQYNYTMFDTFNQIYRNRTILYKCNECCYTVTYKSTDDLHMKSHRLESSYQCEQCGFKSTLKPALIAHAKSHVKKQSGKDCNFASALVSRVSVYRGRHKSDKSFFCINCDFVANNSTDFKYHVMTHKTSGT